MVVVLLIGGWFGSFVRHAERPARGSRSDRERRRCRRLRLGVEERELHFREEGPGFRNPWSISSASIILGHVTSVTLTEADRAALRHVGRLARLQKLEFCSQIANPAGLEPLQDLTELTELSWQLSSPSDVELAYLKEMTQLKKLNLWRSRASGH